MSFTYLDTQEEIKQQIDKRWKKAEAQKKGNNVILSTKDLVLGDLSSTKV